MPRLIGCVCVFWLGCDASTVDSGTSPEVDAGADVVAPLLDVPEGADGSSGPDVVPAHDVAERTPDVVAPPDVGPTPDHGRSPETTEPAPCDAVLIVTAAEAVPAQDCANLESLTADLCNGEVDDVSFGALTSVDQFVNVCLDEGDSFSAPLLASADALTVRFDHDAVSFALGALVVSNTLSVVSERAGATLVVSGVLGAGHVTVEGSAIAHSTRFPDLVQLNSVGFADGTDEIVFETLETVEGNLSPSGQFFSFLETPALVSVSGNVQPTGEFQRFHAPKLSVIGGDFSVAAGPFAANPAFPALKSVGGNVTAVGQVDCDGIPCADLGGGPSQFDFPVLESVGGALWLRNLAAVSHLSFPLLADVGSLEVDGNPVLSGLDLPLLTTVAQDFVVTNNGALPQCLVEAALLTISVGGETTVNQNRTDCTCDEAGAACP